MDMSREAVSQLTFSTTSEVLRLHKVKPEDEDRTLTAFTQYSFSRTEADLVAFQEQLKEALRMDESDGAAMSNAT